MAGVTDEQIAGFLQKEGFFDIAGAQDAYRQQGQELSNAQAVDYYSYLQTKASVDRKLAKTRVPTNEQMQKNSELAQAGKLKQTLARFKPANIAANVLNTTAGIASGVTLNALNLKEGTLGVPFTNIKTKLKYNKDTFIKEVLPTADDWAVESNAAYNVGEFGGSFAPWAKIGGAVTKWTQPLVSKLEAAGKVKGFAGRVGNAATIGGIGIAAEPRDEGESLTGKFAEGAAIGAVFHMGGEGIIKLSQATMSLLGGRGNLKYDSMQDLQGDLIAWAKSKKAFGSDAEAEAWAKQSSVELVKRNGGSLEGLAENSKNALDDAAKVQEDLQGLHDEHMADAEGLAGLAGKADAKHKEWQDKINFWLDGKKPAFGAEAEGASERKMADSLDYMEGNTGEHLGNGKYLQEEAEYLRRRLESGISVSDGELARHPELKYEFGLESKTPVRNLKADKLEEDTRQLLQQFTREKFGGVDEGAVIETITTNLDRLANQEGQHLRAVMLLDELGTPGRLDAGGKRVKLATIDKQSDAEVTAMHEQFYGDTGMMTQWFRGVNARTQDIARLLQTGRKLIESGTDNLTMLLEKWQTTGSHEDAAQFFDFYKEFYEMRALFEGSRANTARAVTAFRNSVSGKKFDFDIHGDMPNLSELYAKDPLKAQYFIDKLSSEKNWKDVAKELKEAKSLADKVKAVKKAQDGNWFLNILGEYRYINMLANQVTLFANIAGYWKTLPFEALSEAASVPVSWTLRKLGSTAAPITFKEVQIRLAAKASTIKRIIESPMKELVGVDIPKEFADKSFVEFLSSLEKGITKESLAGKLSEFEGQRFITSEYIMSNPAMRKIISGIARGGGKALKQGDGTIEDLIKNVMDGVGSGGRLSAFGLQQMADTVGEKMEHAAALEGEIFREAMKVPKESAENALAELKSIVNRRLSGDPEWQKAFSPEAIDTPEKLAVEVDRIEGILARAQQVAEDSTYKGELLGIWRKAAPVATSPLARFLATPFFKTPVILLGRAVQYSPAAPVSSKWRKAVTGGYGEFEQAKMLGRTIVGSSLVTVVAALTSIGRVTGGFTRDEREVMRAAGIPEYSIKIGDTWYDYRKFAPIGMVLGLSADFVQTLHRSEQTENPALDWAGAFFASLASTAASQSMLKGLSDLYDIMTAEEKLTQGKRLMMNMASQYLPYSSLARNINAGLDPYIRDLKEWDDYFKNTYATQLMTVKRDFTGKPVLNQRLSPWLPLQVRTEAGDRPAVKLMAELGMTPNVPPSKIDGVKLTQEQYDEFLEIRDSELHMEDELNAIAAEAHYYSEDEIREAFSSAYRSLSLEAKGVFLDRHPEITDRIMAIKESEENASVEGSEDLNYVDILDRKSRRKGAKTFDMNSIE